MTKIFQVGTLNGFLEGIYEGNYSYEALAQRGDIGLGTFNAVDGEMVAVDGVFYRIDGQGIAHVADPKSCTPFALVSFFKPEKTFQIKNIENLADLNKLLDAHLSTPNILYMIRIEGEMESIHLRSEECQARPYRSLSETLPQLQYVFECNNSKGTIVATRCPFYLREVTIPGYHYHYIDETKAIGGHVFDVNIKSAQVSITPIREFELAIINSAQFDKCDLDTNIDDALKKIE